MAQRVRSGPSIEIMAAKGGVTARHAKNFLQIQAMVVSAGVVRWGSTTTSLAMIESKFQNVLSSAAFMFVAEQHSKQRGSRP